MTLRHAGIDVSSLSREQSLDVRAILQASERTLREQQRLQEPAGSVLTIHSFAATPASGTIVTGADVDVVVRELTLRRGMSRQGGGIYNLGKLAIDNSTIEGNAAISGWADPGLGTVVSGQEAQGGAIYSRGDLTVLRSSSRATSQNTTAAASMSPGAAQASAPPH